MFAEGTIVYFDPFYFKNGNSAKAKYFVVLKKEQDKNIIASLPTRKDSIPNFIAKKHGCINDPSINLNCFAIPPTLTVTTCGKTFDFNTYIYGHQVDSYEIKRLEDVYRLENTDYVIWGEMQPDIFKELIACVVKSKSIKKKFKKILSK